MEIFLFVSFLRQHFLKNKFVGGRIATKLNVNWTCIYNSYDEKIRKNNRNKKKAKKFGKKRQKNY